MPVAPLTPESPSLLIQGSWIGCGVAVAAGFAVAALSGTGVTVDALACGVGLLAIPLALYLVYTHLRPDPIIAAVGGALAIVGVVSFAATILGLSALRLDMPLVDGALARADAAIGLTSPEVLAWLARHRPISDVLGLIYLSAGPAIFVIIPLLAATRQTWRLWELSFVFATTATITALISLFFPAIGAIIHYHVGAEILAQLPPGAGRLYVPTFEAFRSGALRTIDLHHFEGVVTFPSYHAVMALLVAHAWRRMPGATLIKIWSGLVMVSAIPLGGHYVIDLVAGAALWSLFALIAARLRGAAPMPFASLFGARGEVDLPV